MTTGGSAPGAIYEQRRRSRAGTSSTGGRSASGSPTAVRPARPPLSNGRDRLRSAAGRERVRRDVRRRASPERTCSPAAIRASGSAATTSTRSRRQCHRRGPRPGLAASRYVERDPRRTAPTKGRRRPARLRPDPPRRRAGRTHPVGLPGIGGVRRARRAVRVPAPTHVGPHVARVPEPGPRAGGALTPRRLDRRAKARRAGRTCSKGPEDPRRLPAQLARRAGATWILDRAAASSTLSSGDELVVRRAGSRTTRPARRGRLPRLVRGDLRLPAGRTRRPGPRLGPRRPRCHGRDMGRRPRASGSSGC